MSGRLKALDALAVGASRGSLCTLAGRASGPNAAFSAFMEMILADLVHVETLLGRKDKRTRKNKSYWKPAKPQREMKPLYAGVD